MNEAKKEKLKQKLVKANLMDSNDTIIDCLQANYKENLLGKIKSGWKQGYIYFTQEKIVFVAIGSISIPYHKIRKLEKSTQFFLPLGMDVTYEDPDGKTILQKFSLQKRNDWIDFLAEKSGITVE
ncbi:MAG: hypothetical protein IJP31_00955 [Lachnospiraceae bacterium]|nr:hypothetical protein [Lachnospiraceae bacterium]